MFVRGNALRLPFADQSCDLVCGSPPYTDARLYLEDGVDLSISRQCQEWIDWMLDVTTEALRVSKGAVIWVCAGVTRQRTYQPAPEGLLYEWWKRGGSAYRPCYWRRSGIPGSGGDQWFRADVEYVLCFKRPGKLAWSDNTACGEKPKFKPGGEMANRLANGRRANDWQGAANVNRKANSTRDTRYRPCHSQYEAEGLIANPGTLLDTGPAGGGNIGHSLAHQNEAPYDERVPERFIASLCPPGGLVLDPFSGSGTTVSVAMQLGRRGVGLDLRQSQCKLGRRRCGTVTPGFAFA